MATEKLQIRDGKLGYYDYDSPKTFVEERNPYTENRWDIRIDGDTIRVDTDGAGGFHKTFPLRDGILFIYRGTDKRYAYFRDDSFQAWLDAHGIKSVKRQDPNNYYYLYRGRTARSYKSRDGYTSSRLHTDGDMVVIRSDPTAFIDNGGMITTIPNAGLSEDVRVTNATWVVIDKDGHRVLYTQVRDVTALTLPQFAE